MTITMNSNILASALSVGGGPELAKEELQEYVNLGIFARTDNHKEHYAIQPCWTNDPASGVMEEINRRVIGKWSTELNAYVVAVKNIKNFDNSAGMNEDHRWLHLDVAATYYTFSPEEGQRLKGQIKKVGHRAAICVIFDVFTATVFAEDESELKTWNVGDELRFEIYSFVHRRKGPIIRGKSLSRTGGNKRKHSEIEDWEDEEPDRVNGADNSLNETVDLEEESQSSGKKKKKKTKIKQEVDESWEEANSNEIITNTDALFPEHTETNPDHITEHEEETHRKKKKKKKKSSHNE